MAGKLSPASFVGKPIKFGTDGWRGMIAADFTFERVMAVAPRAAIALDRVYGDPTGDRKIIVGYDRRFLSTEFAEIAASAIRDAGFNVLVSECFAPTPAFSWAAKEKNAMGAIVITASHNPAAYSGLKIKGGFGGSVPAEVTKMVESLLPESLPNATPGSLEYFNPWTSYCNEIQTKVNLGQIKDAIAAGKLVVFADVMHGSAATGLERILGLPIHELNGNADPLFDGGAPEPLPRYLSNVMEQIKVYPRKGDELVVGLVFDGDSDRIAAIDGQGNFLSSQILIPILIRHLATNRGYTGEIVKTISGSNLIPKVAELHGLTLHETAVGYKYIADRMNDAKVLLGGEESGGIGYGHHIPERDALLSAMYVLEAVVQGQKDLSVQYGELQEKTGYYSSYDRIDLPLSSMDARDRLVQELKTNPPQQVADHAVTSALDIDGYKLQLADGSWLLIRFSGTEPVLRLYSEAASLERVHENLAWAKEWALSF
ncbi:MAG: phosphoglucomutase/phosphomannomutase family protein [Cyanobacteria bacterium J06638_22]